MHIGLVPSIGLFLSILLLAYLILTLLFPERF
ncbi:MAG: potassium-transporting ATPase subunit F [Terracidiphilus sp.]